MDTEGVQPQEASLTVNEQVIVMSSHETIRVLEVGVDTPLPAEEDRKALEIPPRDIARGSPGETSHPGREDVPPSTQSSCSGEAAGKAKPVTGASPSTIPSVGTFSHATSQQPPTLAPLAVPATQVLTQENLATVVTGVMVPAGTVTQPLLIPISIAGQVAGQQGLAVWTFPTATVAALPGLTAASPTGGIFKPPIANLQGNRCSSAFVFPAAPGQPPILPQPSAAPTPPVAKPLETQTQITVQPAGFAFNPGIVRSLAARGKDAIPAAAIKKTGTPEPPTKNEVQPIQPAPALSQPAVVMANPVPATKASSAPVPITCSETPTVSQLVSRASAPSQSAICRFEKLDITPKSAQKLKPVLEKWLSEAELRNQEGQQNLMEFVGGEPSKKRKRRTSFTPQAIEALNAYFEKNALPTGQEITEIAKELNYDREVVRVWFCNLTESGLVQDFAASLSGIGQELGAGAYSMRDRDVVVSDAQTALHKYVARASGPACFAVWPSPCAAARPKRCATLAVRDPLTPHFWLRELYRGSAARG
ncbi:PREDICTED: POU domain, class 6, transcription factor 1 [Charadrius vociferus]|uniref:POU domain, class 6, transcription factor 1 n=1 Tax=Charadrius vociferus TaxID=50402 RepID=UPI000521B542|nr:PREDICTED: POU domain, class 6, transcription factor 1 [Charadrius vociferus]